MVNVKLWIDDLRPAPDDSWIVAVSSEEAILVLDGLRLTESIDPEVSFVRMSFDHDLGGDDTSRRVMLWMVENEFWPGHVEFHSANPVGRKWLREMAARYAPEHVTVAPQ